MNVVITGANRGIGLALVQGYLAKGAKVFAVCREATPELVATGAEVIEGVDVTAAVSVAALAERLDGVTIDVLINNAGLFQNETLGAIDYDQIIAQFHVNALGALRVSEALISNLARGGKIGLITSRMGSIADNTSGSYYGYRMSKAALNAAGMSLAQDLRGRQVAVAILHPGFVQTRMVGFAGDVAPDTAAAGLIKRMDNLTLETSGSFWHANGEQLPW
ncbi:SDR family oxidoreductase [Saccharophagus degradans]|uniref:SDR family oxidoreductase n=1 Tax=Saccharophagus degradans TaxID=86304 RepID=A0AAW7XEI6_9GAMM|nr:SDR family oxidoreductase [Saccharophagus degradans]MDO6424842.1 SDR family oxidoreductase [Saccharophagus degradans]MDO6606630.1 SDR family oxidoreductase [Saccharophagus degradans]